ncbi:MAG: arylsulfatase [Armatimonadetes bacterium]|nr:arylsulfatase [Armatimonadota bacterium]
MTRRHFIGATAVGLAATQAGIGGAQEATRRPNILLLMTDQHRADCVGADGNPHIHTPNLDRIAREGVLFRCAYSSTPSCTPARSGLLTGMSPWGHGMLGYGRVGYEYPNEMPRMLREAGYYTTGIGKMHWFPQRNLHGFHQTILDESGRSETAGFVSDYRQWFREHAPDLNPDATGIGWNDYQAGVYKLPEELHPTRWTGDTAVDFLEAYDRAEPFYLKVSFARPHSPYDPPQRFMDQYADAPVLPAVIGDWAERNAMRGVDVPKDTPRGDLGVEQMLQSRRAYYGSVSFIDEQIGRILAVLEARGMLDSTLIAFTADHGDMLGDHHLWRKTYAYEGSARIPMLLRWPEGIDAPRGRTLAHPVELRDLLPTFLEAAGSDVDPARFDGKSLLGPVMGKDQDWRETIDLEHSTCYWPENYWNALTDGKTKYVYYAATGKQELFDLANDPGELHDLADDPEHAGTVAAWRQRMVAHLSERGEPFVVNGDLGVRPKPILYGPNYPGSHE